MWPFPSDSPVGTPKLVLQFVPTTTEEGRMTARVLSHTEIEKAMTCWAQWDFAYGGHRVGATLKPRVLAHPLGRGRAWGAAVAAWHAHDGMFAPWAAHSALLAEIEKQVAEQ